MARKAKDLYQLLSARGSSGRSSSKKSSPRARGAQSSPGASIAALWDGFTRWVGWRNESGGKRRSVSLPKRSGFVLSGPALAAIVFVCLGVGFLLGDAIGLGGGDQDLRVVPGGGAGGTGARPGPIGAELEAFQLPPEREVEKLHDHGFLVAAHFGDDTRSEAVWLATWLRSRGIDTARVRRFWGADGQQDAWLVVAYYPGPAPDAGLRRRLRGLPSPSPESVLATQRKVTEDWPPAHQFP